jgi:translation initiation factor 1
MSKTKLNDLSDLRSIFGLGDMTPSPEEKTPNINNSWSSDELQSPVRIHLQRLKGNREVTVIKGLLGSTSNLTELAKDLKKMCGGGGSYKDNEIVIQGNHREKIKDHLIHLGFKNTKLAGG